MRLSRNQLPSNLHDFTIHYSSWNNCAWHCLFSLLRQFFVNWFGHHLFSRHHAPIWNYTQIFWRGKLWSESLTWTVIVISSILVYEANVVWSRSLWDMEPQRAKVWCIWIHMNPSFCHFLHESKNTMSSVVLMGGEVWSGIIVGRIHPIDRLSVNHECWSCASLRTFVVWNLNWKVDLVNGKLCMENYASTIDSRDMCRILCLETSKLDVSLRFVIGGIFLLSSSSDYEWPQPLNKNL